MSQRQESLLFSEQSLVITHRAPEAAQGLCGPLGLVGPGSGGSSAAALLNDPAGEEALIGFFCPYLRLARGLGAGMLLETPTARAGAAWLAGSLQEEAPEVNRRAVAFARLLRSFFDPDRRYVRIGGAVGPAPAGAERDLTREEALLAHFEQVEVLAAAGVDLIVASGIGQVSEAVGLTLAAAAMEMPILVYLTCDKRGVLPCGRSLAQAMAEIDAAVPAELRPVFYGADCADFAAAERALQGLGSAAGRLRALRLACPFLTVVEGRESMLDWSAPATRSPAQLQRSHPHLTLLGGGLEQRPGLLGKVAGRPLAA